MPNAAGLYYFVHDGDNLSRPPVLLLHGAGGTHHEWPASMRRLPGERIYALDLPGHGRSDGVGRQDVFEYAADVVEFMLTIGLRSAVIGGHALGGAIALAIASRNPECVLGLILLGTAALMPVNPAFLSTVTAPGKFRSTIALIVSQSYARDSSSGLKSLGEERMFETRPAVLHGDLIACDTMDLRGDLHGVQMPTLILCGAEDRMVPVERSREMLAAMPDATFRVLPHAGHMMMQERPGESAKEMENFLDRIDFRPGQ